MLSGRRDWLSITPEPERLLPRAIATMRAAGTPSQQAVERERERAERLVLRGSRRRWLRWLREAEALARQRLPREDGRRDHALETAREDALAVISNHNALMRGLPGRSQQEEGT